MGHADHRPLFHRRWAVLVICVKFKEGQGVSWHVGRPVNMQAQDVSVIQADGHELSFALRSLGLDPDDHNPRVQTFVGPAARKIAEAIEVAYRG